MNVGRGTHARDTQDRKHHLAGRQEMHAGAGFQKPGRAIRGARVPDGQRSSHSVGFPSDQGTPLESVKASGTGSAKKSEKPGRAEGRPQSEACGGLADILEKTGRWKREERRETGDRGKANRKKATGSEAVCL